MCKIYCTKEIIKMKRSPDIFISHVTALRVFTVTQKILWNDITENFGFKDFSSDFEMREEIRDGEMPHVYVWCSREGYIIFIMPIFD